MTTITNKTQKPLRVPLPRGKVLHLGPGKTGQIAQNAIEHPPLKALIDAASVEIVDQGRGTHAGGGSGKIGSTTAPARASQGGGRRSGDR